MTWPDYPAISDPARPAWHFGPPAQWMNDPNGTLWHDGWYHVFYQHNPGGEEWGDLHWGHARSRDLVHWEHLPLALAPQHALGEMHCYSGCAAIDASGTPRILYTSVFHDEKHPGVQVCASPHDADLIEWTQDVAHPVLDVTTHGGPVFERGWRDPYVFRAEGRTFLVLGASLGDEAMVVLYENPTGDLRQWTYRGTLVRAPKSATKFFECPNLFPVGKKWVLITSPCRQVEWCTGTLDLQNYVFHVEQRGRVDESDAFYATQTIVDPTGRTILFGWVQRFPKGRGWNGRLSAPRRIWLDDAGWLCSEPVAELAALRGPETKYPAQILSAAPTSLALPGDHSHEAELVLERAPASAVRIEVAGVVIAVGPDGVRFDERPVSVVARVSSPVMGEQGSVQDASPGRVRANSNPGSGATSDDRVKTLIRWLFDRSMIEIFVNDRAVYTRVVPFPSPSIAQLTATGRDAHLIAARAWPLRAAPATKR